VHVLISLVPRDALSPLLVAIGRAGISPTLLEANGPGGAVRRIAVAAPGPVRSRWQQGALIGATAGCTLLAVIAAGLPFVRQWQALDAVDARIEGLKPKVTEAETLRRQIAHEATGTDVTALESARLGNALQAVAALTSILPDDTFLTGLSLTQRKITIDGQSAAAARLISALSADPVIRDAAFNAPVTRNETGADIFSIRAELGP
jgi:general secretion pathway protein L